MDKTVDSYERLLTYSEWYRLNNAFAKKNSIEGYGMRLEYYCDNELCTEILVDEDTKRLLIINHCMSILHRAFGIVEKPTWEDYEYFLEDRCIPKSRQFLKDYLNYYSIPGYDPISLIEQNHGRMAEDHEWIKIFYLKRNVDVKQIIK